MPDYIGNIAVPEITPSGTFPIVSDYGHGLSREPPVAVHRFGSGNAKIEQRFLLGNGARRFTVIRAAMREADRIALRDFWENSYGPYGAFTYNAPNDNGVGTTAVTCRFANEPLPWEFLSDAISSIGVTLIEIPAAPPTYNLNGTLTRFPSSALQTALLSQVQEIIPLIKIQPHATDYPAIYVSDRRCTIGGQLYLARLLEFDGISQSIGNASDEARFIFGNADRVMKELANDTDLFRASVEFSLFHVGTGIKLDLWKGEIIDWQFDDGPEFRVTAADGMYELNLPYPTRRISRTCWKCFNDALGCPFATQSTGMDYTHFPTADPTKCDKGYETANGCLAHGMKRYFGGILAEPQSLTIKDNSTGTWGFGRSSLTSVSLVAESIYDQVIPEIYTDSDMPVICKIAAGREESDFYDGLGIVGEGPLTFAASGHKLDDQNHHGYPGSLGLRLAQGSDPASSPDLFSLGQIGGTGGDWRKVAIGGYVWKDNFAAGVAFLELRRKDEKGLQLSMVSGHTMQAVIQTGMQGWVWTAAGTRSQQTLTNPIWIAINMMLRARGLRFSSASTAEQYFDVDAAIAAAGICNQSVTKIVGSGSETQFKFRGVIEEEKPLRDWVQEILMNCLGYYSFAFGKLRLGIRYNSSVLEAFTEGNILFQSLQLAPLKPAFNHLSSNFADEEFEFASNSVQVYDIDHAKFIGGATAPLFLKSLVNFSGTSGKSQAARLIATRLREELGGITLAHWKAARQLAFQTTVLALNVEPGMICSMTHSDMPGGTGEFRVIGWKLNRDYSIDIQSRTTVDEMYDLTSGPKPADVVASPLPIELPATPPRAVGGKSVAGQGNTTGNPTLTELFIQDDINPDLYHRKVMVEFTPPPVAFNNIFTRRTLVSTPAVQTTGGSIPGNQTFYVEICPRENSVDGIASEPLAIVVPAGTNTNKFTMQCRLPTEATYYTIRIGTYPGRMYQLGSPISTPGSDWFQITVTSISTPNSALLSPDPRFDHVRVQYFFDGSPENIRDAGATAAPTDNQLVFEPEAPEDADTTITVIVRSTNAAESDLFPIDQSPSTTLSLTKDSGNPAGASGLVVLTHADDANIPDGSIALKWSRDTSNYKTIFAIDVWLSAAVPAQGCYAAERAAHPSATIETGTLTVLPANPVMVVTRGSDTAVLQRPLLIYTNDGTPDSDLEGMVIIAQGANSLTVSKAFSKSGNFTFAVVKRWWDLATASETINTGYWSLPVSAIGDPEQLTWRTEPFPCPAGTWYITVSRRNRFGVGPCLVSSSFVVAAITLGVRQVQAINMGIASVEGCNLAGSARSQHVFFESFEGDLSDWETVGTPGGVQSIEPGTGQTGGRVFKSTGYIRKRYLSNTAFNPNRLYEVRCKVKRIAGGAAGTISVGLTCYAADGTTIVSNAGTGGEVHWVNCQSVTPSPDDTWVDYIGWFKGWAAGGFANPSTDPLTPVGLTGSATTGTRYFRPTFMLNYSAGTDTDRMDQMSMDFIDEDGGCRPYRGFDSSGDLSRDIKTTVKISGRAEGIATTVGRLNTAGALINADDIAADGASYVRVNTNQRAGGDRGYAGLDTSGDLSRNVVTNRVVTASITNANVTAGKVSVTTLADIKTDLGTVVAGTFRGAYETAASGARVTIDSTNGLRSIDSGSNVTGQIKTSGSWEINILKSTIASGSWLQMESADILFRVGASPSGVEIVPGGNPAIVRASGATYACGLELQAYGSADPVIISALTGGERLRFPAIGQIQLLNSVAEPAAPAAGGILYAYGGALKYISAGNTRTPIAPN